MFSEPIEYGSVGVLFGIIAFFLADWYRDTKKATKEHKDFLTRPDFEKICKENRGLCQIKCVSEDIKVLSAKVEVISVRMATILTVFQMKGWLLNIPNGIEEKKDGY